MADMLVICPTLRRPANVARLRDSYNGTASDVSDLVFVHGEDTCTAKCNRTALTADRYEAVMFVGDDHVFETPGWDKLLMEPLLERPGICFPDDRARYGHPEVFAMSTAIVRALGWMMLPSQRHYYVDDAILQLGVRAGCITYRQDVHVPHLHWRLTGEPADPIYLRAQAWLDADRESYWRWLRDRSDADVATVREAVSHGT